MKVKFIILILLLLFLPSFLCANEPLVPLMILFLGPTTFGGLFFGSLIGFILIIVVKCGIFLWKSDFKSVWVILYILLANVVSTFIGIVVAGMFTSSMMMPIGIVILYFIFIPPARRMRQFKHFSRNSAWFIAFVLMIMTVITVVIFGIMAGFMETPYIYWPLKIVMCTLGVALSLLIIVLYEEAVISGLYKIHKKEKKSFVKPVLWANIYAFGALMLLGAAIALPKRLSSPDFLIFLFRHIIERTL